MDDSLKLFIEYQEALLLIDVAERRVKEAAKYKLDMTNNLSKAKKAMLHYMHKHDLINDTITVDNRDYKVSRRESPPAVIVGDNLDDIPYEFIRERVIRTPDKIKIKEHLKDNKVNWATLECGEEVLTYELVSVTNEDGTIIKAKG